MLYLILLNKQLITKFIKEATTSLLNLIWWQLTNFYLSTSTKFIMLLKEYTLSNGDSFSE